MCTLVLYRLYKTKITLLDQLKLFCLVCLFPCWLALKTLLIHRLVAVRLWQWINAPFGRLQANPWLSLMDNYLEALSLSFLTIPVLKRNRYPYSLYYKKHTYIQYPCLVVISSLYFLYIALPFTL